MASTKPNLSPQSNSWLTSPSKQGLLTTPSNGAFYLYTDGPPRKANEPAIIFEAGMGSTGIWWAAVQRHLAPQTKLRTYRYDRAGLGRSPPSNLPRTARNIALELEAVLQAAGVAPPYLFVAHSYGGVIVREFLARLEPDAVHGVLFVDTNSEDTYPVLRPPQKAIEAMLTTVDYVQVTGLAQQMKLKPEELAQYQRDGQTSTAAGQEDEHSEDSTRVLGEKKQYETQPLGKRPVAVIFANQFADWTKCLAEAEKDGSVNAEQIEALKGFNQRVRDLGPGISRKQLLLSSGEGRFIVAENSGHNVQLSEPDLVAEQIMFIVRQVV